MKTRIVIWASAGFVVACGWALYFTMASRANPIEPMVFALTRLTCPVAIAGAYFPISIYWSVVANVATYALAGLIVEMLRRQFRHAS